MAGPLMADRVKETTTTPGTGTLDLDGAVEGFQGFVAGIGDGNTCFYAITDGTDWEVGIGTVADASPDTLSRDTILASSNANAAVDWAAGEKDVWCTLPAAIPLNRFTVPDGNVDLNSQKIVNLASPASANDAVNKSYVDALINGFDVKQSVRAATTANITLSGEQTIDGVACVTGDRVLVKNQSTGSQNGVYVVASGSWTRATDADVDAEVTAGLWVRVEEGTSNGDTGWLLTTNNPITVGSTSLTFTQFPTSTGGSHASTHQDGGADEISVTGLSGELADDQPAKINGLSAASDLAEADQVPVYDASATANKKTPLSTLLGLRNLVINGDWSALNGGISSGLSPADNRGIGAKGWHFLGESNGSTKMNFSAPSTNVNAKYSLKATVVTNNEKFAVAYIIPSDQAIPLRGKTLTLSAWLKVTSIDDVRMAVLESTGTADVVSDPISSWGSAGTNPTLTGWSYISESGTPTNKSPNGTLTRYTVSATVGASANNLMVIIWCDDKTTTVTTSVLEVADVELVKGSVYLDAYERLPGRLVSLIKSSSVMAVFRPQDNEPPSANYATPDTRNGHPVLDFDDATDETAIFTGIASELFAHNRYTNALSVLVIWSATSATSGNCYWKAALERCTADDLDVDSDSFASDDGEVAAANGTSGKLIYTVLDALPIPEDSILPLEQFRLKLYRDANNAGDTMSGDGEVHAVIVLDSYDVEKNLAA